MAATITERDYYAMNAPIDFETAKEIWGDPDVNLANDITRRAFFAVWIMAKFEFADMMIEQNDKH